MRFLFGLILCAAQIVAAEAPGGELVPFASLVGPVWVGTFPDGKMTDEQHFEWVFGGKFLRNTHQVKNAEGAVVYEGETIYAWDPKQKTIVWWYWNVTGGFITGTLERHDEGWLAEGENHAPAGQTPAVRSEMRILNGSWESTNYYSQDGNWKQQFRMKFKARGR